GLDPDFYLQHVFAGLNKTPGAITSDEMRKYARAFSNPAAIHASCEVFRSGAGIDLEMDEADEKAGKKIQCPLHALWGAKGTIGSMWDVLATWRGERGGQQTRRRYASGHFLQEESPQELLAELEP